MGIHQPSPEELQEWLATAARRNAILPLQMEVSGRSITIHCSNCGTQFQRKLLPGRNDPVYVCPGCGARNYVPLEW